MGSCANCGRAMNANTGCHPCAMRWSKPPATPALLQPHRFTPLADDGVTGDLFTDEQRSLQMKPSAPYQRKSDR